MDDSPSRDATQSASPSGDSTAGSTSSQSSRRSFKRSSSGRADVPRPPNAWILYRSAKLAEARSNDPPQPSSSAAAASSSAAAYRALATDAENIRQQVRKKHLTAPTAPRTSSGKVLSAQAELSKYIGELWHAEPQEVKDHFQRLAEQKRIEHETTFPDYKYKPRKTEKSIAARMARRRPTNPGPSGEGGESSSAAHRQGQSPDQSPSGRTRRRATRSLTDPTRLEQRLHESVGSSSTRAAASRPYPSSSPRMTTQPVLLKQLWTRDHAHQQLPPSQSRHFLAETVGAGLDRTPKQLMSGSLAPNLLAASTSSAYGSAALLVSTDSDRQQHSDDHVHNLNEQSPGDSHLSHRQGHSPHPKPDPDVASEQLLEAPVLLSQANRTSSALPAASLPTAPHTSHSPQTSVLSSFPSMDYQTGLESSPNTSGTETTPQQTVLSRSYPASTLQSHPGPLFSSGPAAAGLPAAADLTAPPPPPSLGTDGTLHTYAPIHSLVDGTSALNMTGQESAMMLNIDPTLLAAGASLATTGGGLASTLPDMLPLSSSVGSEAAAALDPLSLATSQHHILGQYGQAGALHSDPLFWPGGDMQSQFMRSADRHSQRSQTAPGLSSEALGTSWLQQPSSLMGSAGATMTGEEYDLASLLLDSSISVGDHAPVSMPNPLQESLIHTYLQNPSQQQQQEGSALVGSDPQSGPARPFQHLGELDIFAARPSTAIGLGRSELLPIGLSTSSNHPSGPMPDPFGADTIGPTNMSQPSAVGVDPSSQNFFGFIPLDGMSLDDEVHFPSVAPTTQQQHLAVQQFGQQYRQSVAQRQLQAGEQLQQQQHRLRQQQQQQIEYHHRQELHRLHQHLQQQHQDRYRSRIQVQQQGQQQQRYIQQQQHSRHHLQYFQQQQQPYPLQHDRAEHEIRQQQLGQHQLRQHENHQYYQQQGQQQQQRNPSRPEELHHQGDQQDLRLQ